MTPLKQRFERFIHGLQDEICNALEQLDGSGRFREDLWKRDGGGGGRTRVIEEGAVFEKGGVNTSVVWGELDEVLAKKLPGEGRGFYAAGISLVLHPRSPLVPTVHANFRHLQRGEGPGAKRWFGGGADLTPYYLFEEDAAHFHRTLKAACDPHGEDRYPRFKKWCDEYFFIRHREEARGVGGLFFDQLGGAPGAAATDEALERELDFVESVGRAFLPAYLPIAERRKEREWTAEERAWQEVRRGRYVEFNLVYDRGTTFGLETKGRVESILMSLPPQVRWVYDQHPLPGTEEARLVDVLKNPREWA